MIRKVTLGATYLGNRQCQFLLWAPLAEDVTLHIETPHTVTVPMQKTSRGYYRTIVPDVEPGALYAYEINGDRRPDPASRYQPQDVHGPSQIVDPQFPWEDHSWHGLPLRDYILYELHVGTYTEAGTFDAIIPHLNDLRDIGITAIELMPVAQFPGDRNWGYDGVYPFSTQHSYGGPEGLKRLVNACHLRGLAVVLDVVYNHLGPEGNYLADFAPYFTDRYKTPWGLAMNFDGAHSDDVRRYFIENALYWMTDCHIDALRLDAVHAIADHSADPFIHELSRVAHDQAERLNRRVHLIAESDLNDTRLVRPSELGGYGLDAQWNDGFHHALHALLTGERDGYYQDFGKVRHLAKAFSEGYVYSGQYSAFRRRRHGHSSRQTPADQFVVCAQNHDQVGNRMLGERLSQLIPFEGLKLAAGAVLLAPFIPLLFMGEEYGETAPFPYFISHSDPSLIEAVRRGRREEFTAFDWKELPPDPQSEATFQHAKLNHDRRHDGHHAILRTFYKELIRLRQEFPPLAQLSKETMEVRCLDTQNLLCVRRWCDHAEALILYHFNDTPRPVTLPDLEGDWLKQLDSADTQWHGPGSTIPARLTGGKTMTSLTLPAYALVLFTHNGED